jgi:hypothetical protein
MLQGSHTTIWIRRARAAQATRWLGAFPCSPLRTGMPMQHHMLSDRGKGHEMYRFYKTKILGRDIWCGMDYRLKFDRERNKHQPNEMNMVSHPLTR